jgi:hypothetical protein
VIRADTTHEVLFVRAVDCRDFRAHGLGDLRGMRSDAATRAVDQHVLSSAEFRPSHEVQCVQPTQRHCGGFGETHVVGHSDYRGARRQGDILAIGAEPQPGCAEDVVAD